MERKEEIETIGAWLNNPQVSIAGITQANTVGIQGLGGVGKSTLAAYLYDSLDFTAKFWADVSLKPDFTIFAEKIIVALGGKVSFPIDITELTNNLLQLLNQRRCLLVVDNLETLLDTERNWQDEYYQQFFNRWLQQGRCSTLLITTQDKPQLFKGLQHWYPLGGMKINEGVDLLHQFDIIGTNQELEEFVEYVQGHPLTIKLVAGFLINDRSNQFSQIEELELEQFELAYQEASGSHRNKQDARLAWIIQQHLDRLTNEQTDFLINLSVYRLPFNREAASYMWHESEVKPIVIQRKVRELCDRSLLTKTEANSYQFESLVQKFILQQGIDLTNSHLQAIKYYEENLKEKNSWQVFEDVSEYLELIDHCCELKQHALASNVLDFCLGFLDLQGYYAILIKIHEKLILGWQENLQPEEHVDYAWALNSLGIFKGNIGNVQYAIFCHERALEMFRTISDESGEASSLDNLGNTYYSLGEYQQAIDYHQQSLAIVEQIGDKSGEANSLGNLGIAYYSLGEYQRAIDFHQQSLAIKQQIGDKRGEASSLGNLGIAYYSLGKYQQAIDFYQQSLAIKQQIGDKRGEASSWFNLGITHSNLQQNSVAKTDFEKARKLYQAMGLDKKVEDCDTAIQSINDNL